MDLSRRSLILSAVVGASLAVAEGGWAADGGGPYGLPKYQGLVRGAYVDSVWGQIHYKYVAPTRATGKTPIVFFHPNPFSGDYFKYSLEELGRDRLAIAFDTPGYGASAPPPSPPTMEALVGAFAKALETMGYGRGDKGKVDVTGFHTGAYIASELAAARPDLVRRVVLSGVPFWQGKELEDKVKELLVDEPLTEDGAFAMKEWKIWAAGRNKLLPLQRGHELFTQSVIPGQNIWWAYHAVVKYDARPRFAQISQPVLLINPKGESLAVTTRAVLPLLRNGRIVELPDVPHQMYDLAVADVGRTYRAFLDAPL